MFQQELKYNVVVHRLIFWVIPEAAKQSLVLPEA
jgi:hypothetical protein